MINISKRPVFVPDFMCKMHATDIIAAFDIWKMRVLMDISKMKQRKFTVLFFLRSEWIFFLVHGKWIWVRDKQIIRTAKRFSSDLFVPCSDSFPMNQVNKSPKGHWSLIWVQWALLLIVRFLSKWLNRKHYCHICEISPNSKQNLMRYFNSGYEDALLLLHSDLKKKSFWIGAPHWPIFVPPWIHLWADLAKKPKRMCRAMITSSPASMVNIHQSVL